MSRLVLASASPRRRALLELAGFRFTVEPAVVDEAPRPGEAPEALARRLAEAKAQRVAERQAGGAVVLAADTVVHRDGRVFDKPSDAAEAERTLLALAGGDHLVTTAFCVLGPSGMRSQQVTSRVRFRPFGPGTARRYVATGEPLDKAGAYGIQGLGAVLVASVEGSYTNVVGLPMDEVVAALAACGVRPEEVR